MRELFRHSLQRVPVAEEHTAVLSELSLQRHTSSDLRQYWAVLHKHQWLIGVFCCGVMLTTLIVVLSLTPLYTAETTLVIEPKSPDVLPISQALPEYIGPEETSYYKTQYEMLKSRELAAQVIRQEGLEASLFAEQTDGLIGSVLSRIKAWAMSEASLQYADSGPDNFLGVDIDLVEQYLDEMLEVQPVKQTRLVKVAFRSPDPSLSSRVANAHAVAYIRKGLDLRNQTNDQVQRFLEEKLVELKARVESSEAALNQYRRDKGVISLDDKENIVVERLSDLNRRLTEAEAERIAREAQVYLVQKKNYDSLPAVGSSTLIQTLRQEQARLEAEYANMLKKYKPDYPAMVQLKAQLQETQRRLGKEVNRIVEGVRAAYLAAEKNEAELRAAMEDQKARTLGLKDAAVDYAILAREVDTNRQLYDSVLQRMKEMGVVSEFRSSNVTILDRAVSPVKPSHPKRALSLLVSACIGLMGGVSLAFFYEHLDSSLKTPEDVEHYLQLPSLGVVPDFSSVAGLPHDSDPSKPLLLVSRVENEKRSPLKRGEFEAKERRSSGKPRQSPYGVTEQKKKSVLSQPSLSIVTEAYRSLRVAVLMTKAGGPPRTVLFTSGTNAEGKTATTVNTAVVFAQMGGKILVIDGDLRRPRCHKVLGMMREPGLAEFLTGQLDLQEVIKPTSIENLSLLSSGVGVPDPGELIGSEHMKDCLTVLQQRYDYIFIDSPPVLPVSDALFLATLVDGVILVVKGQHTPRHVVQEARIRLAYAQSRLLGVVLNGVDMKSGDYAYSYGPYATYYHPKEGAEVEI